MKANIWKIKKYWKARDQCHYTGEYRGVTDNICNSKYVVPNNIPIIFLNGSNLGYHFVIKEHKNLKNNLQFQEKTELMGIDKNEEEITKNISYILQFIETSLLQARCQILSIVFLKEFIELNVIIKKCEICRIKYKYCDCFLEYTNFTDYLVEFKCLCCNKNYHHKFEEK